jgi:hypothetical protein
MTPSEIEAVTIRLLSQCTNQLRHRVPLVKSFKIFKYLQKFAPSKHLHVVKSIRVETNGKSS